jgi:hypothetical protein
VSLDLTGATERSGRGGKQTPEPWEELGRC